MRKVVSFSAAGGTGLNVYMVFVQRSSNHVLDGTDLTYKAESSLAAPANAAIALTELSIKGMLSQVYQRIFVDAPANPWKSDTYYGFVYKRIGANPDFAVDSLIGNITLKVQNDEILDRFHSYSGEV